MSIPSTGLSDWEFGLLPMAVGPKTAGHLLDLGLTKIYDLINSGELEAYWDGTARKITTRSIRARIERLLAQAESSQPERRGRTEAATEASLVSRKARKAAATDARAGSHAMAEAAARATVGRARAPRA
jgi:hypothetical protein